MKYLFIDGAYLRERYSEQMRQFYDEVPAIQYDVLAASLRGQRVYYYDAINYNQGKDESTDQWKARIERTQSLHDHIASRSGFHVREGHVRRSAEKKRQEQKGVDVQLAVEALEHAARGNMELATIFTGDLDFEPLFASLARLGVRTKLVYVLQHAALELRQAADEVMKVTLEHFYRWATPSFQAANHQVHLRYREQVDASAFSVIRRGLFNGRVAHIFHSPNSNDFRLHVAQGDELSEPSYLMLYPNADKLDEAFALTFGPVEWE